MIKARKLIKLTRKWQKLAAIRRKRITMPQTSGTADKSNCSISTKAEKECFDVYSADQKRFLLPLEYINSEMIRELFNMAEEEFGLPSNGPLILPCDSEVMEYAIALIKQQVTRDVESTLLNSIASSCSSLSCHLQHEVTSHQLAICSF